MTTVEFEVQRSPFPFINQFMRAVDLCDSVTINGAESICETYRITWKVGEVIDEARKQFAKDNIKQALEKLGYDCYSISEIQAIGSTQEIRS